MIKRPNPIDAREIWFLSEEDCYIFYRKHWEEFGLTPWFLKTLNVSKGWWPDLIDDTFQEIIGPDYATMKLDDIVFVLRFKGFDIPDDKPIIDSVHYILYEIYNDINIGQVAMRLNISYPNY